MSRQNIDQKIRDLVADGQLVFSSALGRVGEVVFVDPNPNGIFPIVICSKSRTWRRVQRHRHQHGCTTFNTGDAVHIEKRGAYYLVVNTALKKA